MSPLALLRTHGSAPARVGSVRIQTPLSELNTLLVQARQQAVQSAQTLWAMALPFLLLLVSVQTRHWLTEVAATICVVGGFIAAPLLTLAAWIGLALPESLPLHQASPTLFMVAIIWLALALVSAHLHQDAQRNDA